MMDKTQTKPLTAAQQRQRDQKRRTWLRAGVQLFFFVSMPGAFVAGFSGVKQIFLHIGAGEVLTADSFTLSLLGLCGFTLLFDRFFCGYACAFGSLGDAVWALSGLLQKKLLYPGKPGHERARHGHKEEQLHPGAQPCTAHFVPLSLLRRR